ncbi:MAG: hypothetical protein ACOY4O_15130 [Pseudomonadota bacterium]|jgi:hypothetical protein
MPLLRYFVVVGGLLLGCFWALDAMNGSAAPRAQQGMAQQGMAQRGMASLEAWRAAEARKESARQGRETAEAVVMPDIATLPPTAERLAYERQLASNAIPAPVAVAESPDTVSDARAEMAQIAPQSNKPVAKPKPKRKPVVVASQKPQRNPEFANSFFGGIFSN